MLTLKNILQDLDLKVLAGKNLIENQTPSGGYASDLLSCVMASAQKNSLWITLQAHANIVAVAALLDLCAVIITENVQPDEETIEKAERENVILLSTSHETFFLAGKLWEMGVRVGEEAS